MKTTTYSCLCVSLALLLILTACAPSQYLPAPPAAQPLAQPADDPATAADVPLLLWNEEEQLYEIRAIDPTTSEVVSGNSAVKLGSGFVAPGWSPDGRWLVAVESHGSRCELGACRPSTDALHLADVGAWRWVTVTPPVPGWLGAHAFSPDGAHVVLVQNRYHSSTLLVYALDTGELLAQRELDFRPLSLTYTQDGAHLAVYGQPPHGTPSVTGKPDVPRILLADAATLELLWEQPLEDILSGRWCLDCDSPLLHGGLYARWEPAVVPAHDGRALYIAHADEARLTTVDLEARTVQSVTVQAARSWLEWLLALTARVAEAKIAMSGATKMAVLSADGRQLYVASEIRPTRDADGRLVGMETQHHLQAIEVKTGRIVASRDLEVSGMALALHSMQFTSDGAHLILTGWGDGGARWSYIFEPETLEPVAQRDGWVLVTRRMDGEMMMVGIRRSQERTELALVDPQSLEFIDTLALAAYATWLVTSPR